MLPDVFLFHFEQFSLMGPQKTRVCGPFSWLKGPLFWNVPSSYQHYLTQCFYFVALFLVFGPFPGFCGPLGSLLKMLPDVFLFFWANFTHGATKTRVCGPFSWIKGPVYWNCPVAVNITLRSVFILWPLSWFLDPFLVLRPLRAFNENVSRCVFV